MKPLSHAATGVALLLSAPAFATTYEVTTSLDVTQEILVDAVGDPSYYDSWQDTYPFWDEYHRIVTQEADVWDASQIPSSPQSASSDPLMSDGNITLTFGYSDGDIDVTNLVYGAVDPDTGANAVDYGTLSLGAAAYIDTGSALYYEYFPDDITVYSHNDMDVGGGTTLDVMFFSVFDIFDATDGSSEDLFFAIGFADDYFEGLNMGALSLDFSQASLSYLSYFSDTNAYDGGDLYEEMIEGYGDTVTVAAYDGTIGDGELPAVPLPAGLPLLLGGLGALGLLRRRKG